jgi:hypothetical protein
MELEAKRSLFIHLTEEALEEYAFGRLPEGELASFEAHLLHCEHCQQRLETEDNFVEALRVLQRMNEPPARSQAAARSDSAARPNVAAPCNVDIRSNVDARSNPTALPDLAARSNVDAGPNAAAVKSLALPVPVIAATPSARRGFWTPVLFSTSDWLRPASGIALLAVLVMGMYAWRMPLGREFADDARPGQAVTLTTLRGGASNGVAQARAGHPLDLSINVASLSASLPEAGPYRLEVVDAAGEQCWIGAVTPVLSAWSAGRIGARVNKPLGAGVYWVRLYAPSGKLLREFGLHLD